MASPSLALGEGSNASKFTITNNEFVVERAADSEHTLRDISSGMDLLTV